MSSVRSSFTALLAGLACWLLGALPAHATHIVGGQLSMQYLGTPGRFNFSLTVYQDAISSIRTYSVIATIYSKRTNARMDTIRMRWIDTARLAYSNPVCIIGNLNTVRWFYQHNKTLTPSRYNDSQGYYVVWQSCCRNAAVVNLDDPLSIGQTYYLDFPALQDAAGVPFINSSPTNFAPLRDYSCKNKDRLIPFGGTDPDGDSLTYELTQPLDGDLNSTGEPRNQWTPAAWASGYNVATQIKGTPKLSVNPRTGQLRVNPSQEGLFVFAIKIKEFRQGRQIGEMNRDFQMLVVACPINRPPSMRATDFGSPTVAHTLSPTTTLTLPLPGEPGERCLNVYATDVEQNSLVRLRIVPLDSVRAAPAFSVETGLVNRTGRYDSLYSKLCFDDCFALTSDTMHFLLIVEDQGCPQPEADTVLLAVRIPIPDAKSFIPNIFTPNGDGVNDTFLPGKIPGDNPCYPIALRRMRIYNRWGREVFNTTLDGNGWGGNGCAPGTYYYFLEYADRVYKGWVELARQ